MFLPFLPFAYLVVFPSFNFLPSSQDAEDRASRAGAILLNEVSGVQLDYDTKGPGRWLIKLHTSGRVWELGDTDSDNAVKWCAVLQQVTSRRYAPPLPDLDLPEELQGKDLIEESGDDEDGEDGGGDDGGGGGDGDGKGGGESKAAGGAGGAGGSGGGAYGGMGVKKGSARRLRSGGSICMDTFMLEVDSGPLGMNLVSNVIGLPMVAQFVKQGKDKDKAGPCEAAGTVKRGDLLVNVNGTSLRGLGFDAAVDVIRALEFPAKLTFETPQEETGIRLSGWVYRRLGDMSYAKQFMELSDTEMRCYWNYKKGVAKDAAEVSPWSEGGREGGRESEREREREEGRKEGREEYTPLTYLDVHHRPNPPPYFYILLLLAFVVASTIKYRSSSCQRSTRSLRCWTRAARTRWGTSWSSTRTWRSCRCSVRRTATTSCCGSRRSPPPMSRTRTRTPGSGRSPSMTWPSSRKTAPTPRC